MTFAITGGNASFNHLTTPDKRMISGWVQNATVNITGIPFSCLNDGAWCDGRFRRTWHRKV